MRDGARAGLRKTTQACRGIRHPLSMKVRASREAQRLPRWRFHCVSIHASAREATVASAEAHG